MSHRRRQYQTVIYFLLSVVICQGYSKADIHALNSCSCSYLEVLAFRGSAFCQNIVVGSLAAYSQGLFQKIQRIYKRDYYQKGQVLGESLHWPRLALYRVVQGHRILLEISILQTLIQWCITFVFSRQVSELRKIDCPLSNQVIHKCVLVHHSNLKLAHHAVKSKGLKPNRFFTRSSCCSGSILLWPDAQNAIGVLEKYRCTIFPNIQVSRERIPQFSLIQKLIVNFPLKSLPLEIYQTHSITILINYEQDFSKIAVLFKKKQITANKLWADFCPAVYQNLQLVSVIVIAWQLKINMLLSDPPALSLTNLIVLRKLGRGGTSHVFLAQSTRDKQLYAMKVFDKKSKSFNFPALSKEISLHQQLNHKYIVRLHSHIEDNDNHYVLTQYCEGGELTKKVVSTLQEHQLADIISQISEALSYMHSKGVVHCDLKLSNLLLHKGKIKICDFGYSRRIEEGPSTKICGTIFYMAPEIIKEKRRVHFKEADVWALGICLLILITRQEPYAGNDIYEISQKIIQGNRVSLPPVSKELQDLLSKLLEVDPQQRMSLDSLQTHPFILKYKQKVENDCLTRGGSKNTKEEVKIQSQQQKRHQNYSKMVQWSFKRASKINQAKDTELTTHKKKAVTLNLDNDTTVKSKTGILRRQSNKQLFQNPDNDLTIKVHQKLLRIDARLISPLSSFYYQTKQDGFIRINASGDITIKVKGTTFSIIDQGHTIKVGTDCFTLDQLNESQQKKCQQIHGLYEYALNIIGLLKGKKYSSQRVYKLDGEDVMVGTLKGRRKLIILCNMDSKGALIQYDMEKKSLRLRKQANIQGFEQVKEQDHEVTTLVNFVLSKSE